jgi:hypothetical protein
MQESNGIVTDAPVLRCETVRDWMRALGYKNRRSIDKLLADGHLPPRVPGVGKLLWPPGSIAKFLNDVLNQPKP